MAAKKATQTQTLKEFQAWLEGVEELQPKGWVPDKQQWAKIRKRIANIAEDIIPIVPAGPARLPMAPAPGPVPYIPPPQQPYVPTNVEISPAAKALLTSGKTPDSDASSGQADSPFE